MQRAMSFCRMWKFLKTGKLAVLNDRLGWHVRWRHLISSYDLTKYFACVHSFPCLWGPVVLDGDLQAYWKRAWAFEESGRNRPILLALKLTQRLVFVPLRCLLPPVRCTFCFISNAVCSLGIKAYRFSRTNNRRKLRLCRDDIHSNKERCKAKTIEPWLRKDFSPKLSWLQSTWRIWTLLMSKLPLRCKMKNAPKKILLFWLFTRKTSPHGYGLKDLVEAILEIDKEPSASRDPKRANRMVGKWESHLVESFF